MQLIIFKSYITLLHTLYGFILIWILLCWTTVYICLFISAWGSYTIPCHLCFSSSVSGLQTMLAYSRYFKDFLPFLVVAGLSLPQVSAIGILAYMEYLHRNGMSLSNITIILLESGLYFIWPECATI